MHNELVFLPGLLCDRRLWDQQIAGLADIARKHTGNNVAMQTAILAGYGLPLDVPMCLRGSQVAGPNS